MEKKSDFSKIKKGTLTKKAKNSKGVSKTTGNIKKSWLEEKTKSKNKKN